jgi:hypothetical protein
MHETYRSQTKSRQWKFSQYGTRWSQKRNSMKQSPSYEDNSFHLVEKFPVFMVPEDSSPHSQVPATSPCPEPDQSIPAIPTSFLKIHFKIILSPTFGSSKWSLSLRIPYQNPVCTSFLPHTYYMPRQSHFS